MATADQLEALIRSHVNGDDTGFYAIALRALASCDHTKSARGHAG